MISVGIDVSKGKSTICILKPYGEIVCSPCGRKMFRNRNAKRKYYTCRRSVYAPSITKCPIDERFYENDLEKAVLHNFRQMLTLFAERADAVEQAARRTESSSENLRITLRQVEKSIKQNNVLRMQGYEKYNDGIISRENFIQLKNRMSEELSGLTERRADIEERLAAIEAASDSELAAEGGKARQILKEDEITNQMLLAFIERIDVYSGMRIKIKYRFSDELMNQLTVETSLVAC